MTDTLRLAIRYMLTEDEAAEYLRMVPPDVAEEACKAHAYGMRQWQVKQMLALGITDARQMWLTWGSNPRMA